MATTRNAAVVRRPTVKVNHEAPSGLCVPGTKTPTTKEPKIIFAPSRKKFERMRTRSSVITNLLYQDK